MKPPRPCCLEEPCNSWEKRRGYCGHEIIAGKGACLLDDPERMEQRAERMRRKAMEAKAR